MGTWKITTMEAVSRLLLVTQMSTLLLTIVTFHGETVMEEKGYYNDSLWL